jgi:two-component system sensor histidine kinase YesM
MLQAQINPHFLFNTLNSLKWSAMLSGNKTLDEGIGALSALLQNTIINNKERIPFSAEIENVKNYAVIQRIRYADSFNLNFDIESGLENAVVLRFILQPIVENSIIHGNNSDERQITINVKAYSENNDLKIVISDDGIGFSVEENSESKNKLSGIGITNVDERIRLNFGENYGITVKSKIGVGTTSYIKIPLIYEKEKKDV